MKERDWDQVASRYDEEIFHVLANDRNRVLIEQIQRYTSKKSVAGDFGCGVGRILPLLASRCRKVFAVDFSQRSLNIAQDACSEHKNVVYLKHDLAVERPNICKADIVMSVSVLIMHEAEKRLAILKNIYRNLRPGGHLLLVVPSLETVILTYSRLIEWYCREGNEHRESVKEVAGIARQELTSIVEGIVQINGTPTKHYLREEARVMLKQNKFKPVAEMKVEYGWKEDFEDPPRWLKEPYPWDWLFVAQRN